MLTINWQVVPQVLNFLILQVITQVFQDGFQFRDMTLPTLRKNEVIKNRNWNLKKMLVIFMHQLQLDETNTLHNYQKKKKRKLFTVTREMSSTLSTIKTYCGHQEYICGSFQGPFL